MLFLSAGAGEPPSQMEGAGNIQCSCGQAECCSSKCSPKLFGVIFLENRSRQAARCYSWFHRSLSIWQWLCACVLPDAFCPCYPGSDPLASLLPLLPTLFEAPSLRPGTIISCGFVQKSREQAALAAKGMFHTAWALVLDVAVLHSTFFCPSPCFRSLLAAGGTCCVSLT